MRSVVRGAEERSEECPAARGRLGPAPGLKTPDAEGRGTLCWNRRPRRFLTTNTNSVLRLAKPYMSQSRGERWLAAVGFP